THYLHIGLGTFFAATAIISFGAAVYTVWLLPDSLLRLMLWFATHTLYRMDISGAENAPARGGALLVPNHASMADAALVIESTDRPVRFLMFKDPYDHPIVQPPPTAPPVIPIPPHPPPP